MRSNTMFSVIMPVYNRADIVERAIKSVLSQTFEDYELIIIDDGSKDNLEKIISLYVSKNVRYYKIPHSGVSVARNEGIKYAKGDFLAYLDSDNTWHPEFLSVMYNSIVKSEAEAAYCKYNVYRRYPLNQKLYLHHVSGEEFNYTKLLDGNYIDLNAFIHTRKSIEDVGIFDIQLKRFVDWDLILRITSKYDPVFVQKVLVDYYQNIVENTITLNEDIRSSYDVLKSKHHMKKYHKRSIIVEHDTIEYLCENVPEKKYNNWMMMSRPEIAAQARTLDFGSKGYPYMLQIEPTNICNLSCPLCPTGRNELNRKPRHMKFDEFKAIIDDMEEYLLFLVLWDWGEPFMNPELPKMISYASEQGIKIVTSTNAHFLHNEQYLKEILRSGLSNLIVAIDSLDETNYAVYRKKGELDKTILGLKNLIRLRNELKSETKINLRMVVMKQNENEISEIRDFTKRLEVDVFTVKTVNPSCGLTSIDEEIIPSNPKYRRYRYKEGTNERIRINTQCTRIWHMSNIFSNGDVVPCAYDYDSELKIGNIHEKPFSEIWNSPIYRNLRKKIYYEKNSIPKCRECTINFELSNSGWFVESNDFKVHTEDIQVLREELQEQENQIKQFNEAITDLNNSITLRFARKIPFGKQIKKILSAR
ncbi:glycosyltransferase [Thermoproteota archaeon]